MKDMVWRRTARTTAAALLLLGVGCVEEDPSYIFPEDELTGTVGPGATGPGSSTTDDATTGDDPSGDGSTGSIGNCESTPEACNGEDDNCDGVVDEGCDCVDGDSEDCFSGDMANRGVGLCATGTRTCADGTWGTCEGETLPTDEVCNGADDDCDGGTDEDFGQLTCGVGICMVVVDACTNGSEVECVPGDPTDEECNGLDDDCDGDVDELPCECLNGEEQDCYTGPMGTAGVGLCEEGTQTCVDGQWGPCENSVIPVPEVCDGDDNDCDGADDNGDPGGGNACNTQLPGVCAPGVTACTGGSVVCEQNVFPSNEVCDGFDNDCDTGIDEGNPGGGAACNTGLLGACADGETLCQGATLGCQQTIFSQIETCNGVDDDCDGNTDENNPEGGQNCDTGLEGACGVGTTNCNGGTLDCDQTTFSSPETCNGVDDDCDGSVDEGVTGGGQPCPTGLLGVCATGESDCSGGAPVCNQTVFPSTEICDGFDNDCDGSIDEGNPGGGGACSTGQAGVCGPGTLTCTGGGVTCEPNVAASTEICDGLDNDCDGGTDENNPGGGEVCATGNMGVCAAGTTACSAGGIVCNQDVGPSSETCNGLDDDCDGGTDENNPEGGQACSTGLQGVCAAGTTECLGGGLNCNQDVLSSTEICDGLDNDCDGSIDEGNPGAGVSCDTGQFGECAAGTTVCAGAGGVVCQPDTAASPEVCDGLDNDCDDAVDEGNPGGGVFCDTGLLGVCADGTTNCNGGTLDCDQDVMASAMEICDDGLDNTCDGNVDEGCPCPDQLLDGGFEGGIPNPDWTEASIQFGTPLCTVAGCGPGGGSGPANGTVWSWFGGFPAWGSRPLRSARSSRFRPDSRPPWSSSSRSPCARRIPEIPSLSASMGRRCSPPTTPTLRASQSATCCSRSTSPRLPTTAVTRCCWKPPRRARAR